MEAFAERLAARAKEAGSWLCVGLDPEPATFPAGLEADDVREFCSSIIAATSDVACAYKPNSAFFEALGTDGLSILADVIAAVPPTIPVILDGKRNDIGNTARKYAEAAFDELGADAVTVTPYLGLDTVEPFATYEEKGVFLLCRTSNPSAPELQDLPVDRAGTSMWQHVATLAMREWQPKFGNLGLVAGATYPDELAQIRALAGDGIPLLIPGVGAQGGSAEKAFAAGVDTQGAFAVVNVGRGILRAGSGNDWQAEVRAAAERYAVSVPA